MSKYPNKEERQCYIIRYEDGKLRSMTGTVEEVRERAQDWVKEHGPIAVIA